MQQQYAPTTPVGFTMPGAMPMLGGAPMHASMPHGYDYGQNPMMGGWPMTEPWANAAAMGGLMPATPFHQRSSPRSETPPEEVRRSRKAAMLDASIAYGGENHQVRLLVGQQAANNFDSDRAKINCGW